jgi:hypothetical protein
MKTNRNNWKFGATKKIKTHIKISFVRIVIIGLTIVFMVLIVHCEGKDRYYRPNLPEKLCSIGVIDADDTSDYDVLPMPVDNRTSARIISFEKSYQSEYPEDVNDSLRGFSFSISSSDKELFNFKSDTAIKNFKGFKIPAGIDFRTNEKYYLFAREQNTPEISAEVIVPVSPLKPKLISINRENLKLSEPTECIGYTTVKSAVIDFSFENDNRTDIYYAILLEGDGDNVSSTFPIRKSQLEFEVRYCNTKGFFAILPGFTMYRITCMADRNFDRTPFIKVPVSVYIIEGSKIPDNKCTIKISTQFQNESSPFDYLRSLRVRLLSIPKELFLFEKSLYSYNLNSKDPFSEPIYLNGNIKGGNGVFAICRSSELIINFSPWY